MIDSKPPSEDNGTPSAWGTERRLAAIAVIDVVGYTRLMEADEQGTHARWMEMGRALIIPKVRDYNGQIVKSTGDGFLIEFRSAVEAVRWALDLHTTLAAHEPSGTVLPLRIAIHLADIIPETDDIFGDGVNIASRLQGYADSGSIVVSSAVHEQVRTVLEYSVYDMGPLTLKNIQRPIQAYSIAPVNEKPRIRPVVPGKGREPSIAVLPLRTLGSGPVDPYFAEGIAHDIVASLAGLKELFVVSSRSTVALGNATVDVVEIGRRLGVRYLVEGNVARAGERLRMYVELTEVDTRSVIWSGRYDITESEFFTTQDVIASKIAYSLIPHLRQSELGRALRKAPEDMGAYDLVLQAIYRLHRFGEGDFEAAHHLLNRAIARDPRYSTAYALLAEWHTIRVGQGYSTNFKSDSMEAHRLAVLALEHNPSDPLALALYGHGRSFLFGEYERALDAFDRAITSSPSSALAWGFSSPTYSYLGEGSMAIQRAEYALRLSPLDPYSYWAQSALTLAHYVNGTHEESVRWGWKTRAANPRYTANLRPLIGSLMALGRHDEARTVVDELIKLQPNFHVEAFIARYPMRDLSARALYQQRLLAAGLPK